MPAQLVISTMLAGVLFFVQTSAGYSALIGGGIAAVATAFAAWYINRDRSTAPAPALAALYIAWLGRLAITAMLLTMAIFWVQPLHLGGLLGAYIAAVIAGSLAAARGSAPAQAVERTNS